MKFYNSHIEMWSLLVAQGLESSVSVVRVCDPHLLIAPMILIVSFL